MRKLFYLALSLFVAVLTSCTQRQGPSEQEIQDRINAAVRTALDSVNSSNSDDASVSSSSSSNADEVSSSSSSDNASSFVGTYTVNDGVHTWEIVLKSDETCTMGMKGSSNVAYGSWGKYDMYDCVGLHFPGENLTVFFPEGEENLNLWIPGIDIKDGYFYKDVSAVQAKNPKKRLAITKVR